jgi:hypothetical protein
MEKTELPIAIINLEKSPICAYPLRPNAKTFSSLSRGFQYWIPLEREACRKTRAGQKINKECYKILAYYIESL